MMNTSDATVSGVDTLIAKLRKDGVTAGRVEAERIIAEAKATAEGIISSTKADADALINEARRSAERYKAAGEEAINTAMRDAVLTMKAGLMAQFEADVNRMVSSALADPDLLKQMVIELVGRARDATRAGENTEVILPAEIVGPEAIRDNPEDIQSGELTQFVLGLTQNMLQDGVTLHAASDLHGGIRARIKGREVDLELSDDAVASLLMQHLQPRFRAVMEGVIK